MNWTAIEQAIHTATGQGFHIRDRHSVGGGCINDAWQIQGDGQAYFVKVNRASGLAMFEAEAAGLQELAEAGVIRVPRPITAGTSEGQAYLVMEYIPLGGRSNAALLGEQLAALHRVTREEYGWHRDNTIGSTPQINTPGKDWVSFWREHRLGFQLELAGQRGIGHGALRKGERLQEGLTGFFSTYQPQASLLHGDLWSGNYAADEQGMPVIFDPAVYFGDRETDIAMTELFGGFGAGFYTAYRQHWPLDSGYGVRKTLYNLYHILNHFNLFGGGYGMQAERMIEQLLAELSA